MRLIWCVRTRPYLCKMRSFSIIKPVLIPGRIHQKKSPHFLCVKSIECRNDRSNSVRVHLIQYAQHVQYTVHNSSLVLQQGKQAFFRQLKITNLTLSDSLLPV